MVFIASAALDLGMHSTLIKLYQELKRMGDEGHTHELEGPAPPWVAFSSVGDMVQDSVQFCALMHVGIKVIFVFLLMGWLYFVLFVD